MQTPHMASPSPASCAILPTNLPSMCAKEPMHLTVRRIGIYNWQPHDDTANARNAASN